MLCNDYFTYEKRAEQSGGSPHCRSCSNKETNEESPAESIVHILTTCISYSNVRQRIFREFSTLCQQSKNKIDFNKILVDKNTLCQFLLDASSINLKLRISSSDPILPEFFKLSRDFCYTVHIKRMKILMDKQKKDKLKNKGQQQK